MSLILNIETSSKKASVNLAEMGKTLHQINGSEEEGISQEITMLINKLLIEVQKKIENLDAIAISIGPGSYTSLRIGMSVAKALCYGKELPFIGIPTLELLALHTIEKQNHREAFYLSLIDAKRMDVYAAAYNERGKIILPASFVTLTVEWFEQWKEKKAIISGNANLKIKTLGNIEKTLFLTDIEQTAETMSKTSHEYYKQGNFIDVAYSIPYYLKPPNITKAKNIL